MTSDQKFIVYFIIKILVYSFWCARGIRIDGTAPTVQRSIFLGLLRTAIGLLLGALVWVFLSTWIGTPGFFKNWVHSLLVFIPVRWLEWGLIELAITHSIEPNSLLFGASGKFRLWRVGGIVISYVSDAYLLFGGATLPFRLC
jgi:hypothetical protein